LVDEAIHNFILPRLRFSSKETNSFNLSNKVEHRLFSHISMNWRGRPLVSHEVVVKLIGATKTKTGLKVKAKLDKGKYPRKIKVSDEEMASLNIQPHEFHGEWNYTIRPKKQKSGK